MSGRNLWEYLQDTYPGISDTEIAKLAGVTPSAVTGWKFYNHRPGYDTVRGLCKALHETYPRRGYESEYYFLHRAGYSLPSDPEVAQLQQFIQEWADLTTRLVESRPPVRWQALRATEKVLKENQSAP